APLDRYHLEAAGRRYHDHRSVIAGGKGVVQLFDIPPVTLVIGPCPGIDPPTGAVCQGRADLGIGSSDQQDIAGSSADAGHSSTVVPVDGPVVDRKSVE